jgi:outer membrane receptor protein involved in Fe transport
MFNLTVLKGQTAIRGTLVALCVAAWICPAGAQTAPKAKADSAPADIETVEVTGSRIKRKDADSVGALTTLTAQDLKLTSLSSVGDILQKLPTAGVSYNSNGTQGTSYGGSSISLRYLANSDGNADRTLVLVDGHRWVDGTGARGIRDFVDLNTIPIGMINTVEVLQDGASAIYGADAIAGVVNLHTKTALEGFDVESKYGISSRGDGQEYSGVVNYGHSLERGSIFLSASYVKTEPVQTADRDITQVSLTGGLANLKTAPSSPRGLYILPGFSTTAAPITQNVGITTATGKSSYHIAVLPDDYYNTQAQGINAIGPSERYGFYGKLTQDITSHLNVTLDALYNRRQSSQEFSPTSLSIGGSSGTSKGFAIAANQLYNPFATAFTAAQAWNIQMFTAAVGDRKNVQDVQNYRTSLTFKGDVSAFNRQWDWNLFGSYSQNDMDFKALNNIDLEHLALGLGSPAACSAQPGCVPVNIFGQMDSTQAAYIRANAHETNQTKLIDTTFDVTGKIADLPAGPLATAFGVEWRRNQGHDSPDAYINTISTGTGALPLPAATSTTTGQSRTPTANGSYDVKEAFIEFTIPILADLAFARKFEADVAARLSDYSSAGSKATTKVGLAYRPIDDVLLRGTFSQGFRAPSLIELYTGQRQTTLAGSNTDPCNGGAAAHPNLPGCAGIPSTYNQNNYNSGTLPQTLSGNPGLKPETAETWSYGLALTPHWLHGFTATSDWYRVTITNAIQTPAVTTALQICAVYGGSFCNILSRDSSSGQVLNFLSSYENLNRIVTQGLDTTLRYNFETGRSQWEAVVSATYLDRFEIVAPNPLGGAPLVTEAAGTSTGGTTPATARSTYPHWKGLASLRWNYEDWGALWRGRYIGSTTDGAAPALPVTPVKGPKVDAIMYNDIQIQRELPSYNARIFVGMNNIFDKMPPLSYANAPINFDMYTYDPMGRYMFVKVNFSF